MASSLFVRANGSLSCWCDHGKSITLGRLSEEELRAPGHEAMELPSLREIRRAFAEGRAPHPGTCDGCAMYDNRLPTDRDASCRFMTMLHVEPSILCRLRCQDCVQHLEGPPRNLPLPLLDALLANLRESGIESIRVVHFEGLGEPTMNPALADMIVHTREQFPDARIVLTTNGNAPWSTELAAAPIDHLRVSIDGIDQESYGRYRKGGSFARARAFLAEAAGSRARTGWPRDIDWKYVLFEWNDTDEHLVAANRMALELGVRCTFDISFAPGDATRRFDPGTLEARLAAIAPEAVSIAHVRRSGWKREAAGVPQR